jgi:pimeloyl-ACP methyl ester carboxylesterase
VAIDALSRALQRHGVTAVTYDPRGPSAPAEVGPSVQLADLSALLDDHAAPRTVLIGHCYGGLLALLTAAVDPRVTDVVALMPTRCFIWPDDHDPDRDTWRRDGGHRFHRRGQDITVPYSAVEDALRYDLPAALPHVKPRVLFVAGEHDELIGVPPVRRLAGECGSPDTELVVLPVQHDFRDRPAEIALVERVVLAWLDRGP